MRKIAISDIHGCFFTFQSMLDRLGLTQKDELFLLGDFVDRGSHSKLVFDHIFELKQQGFKLICLRGNHEQMLLDALFHTQIEVNRFEINGGRATLDSFKANEVIDIPRFYIDFINELSFYHLDTPYIFVHGGLDFRYQEDPLKREQAMLWMRNWYEKTDYTWLGERYIIHGHTPIPRIAVEKQWENFETLRIINIDNGCVYDQEGMGNLCALDLTNRQLFFEHRHRLDRQLL